MPEIFSKSRQNMSNQSIFTIKNIIMYRNNSKELLPKNSPNSFATINEVRNAYNLSSIPDGDTLHDYNGTVVTQDELLYEDGVDNIDL